MLIYARIEIIHQGFDTPNRPSYSTIGGSFLRWSRINAMKIEIADLTEQNLREVPEWESPPFSCKYCLYWECPEQSVDPAAETKDSLMRKKTDWLWRVKNSFGNCGKIAYVDGVAAGYAQYAPPEDLPQAANYPSGPASTEAVLISCLFIPQKQFRGLGIGLQLLQSILVELRQRSVKAIETFARRGKDNNPSGPVEFYLSKGFNILHEEVEYPLLHLDL